MKFRDQDKGLGVVYDCHKVKNRKMVDNILTNIKLIDLGFKVLFIDAKAMPFLEKKNMIHEIEDFSRFGKIYALGKNNRLT